MDAQFNAALVALAGSTRPPWALISPGTHVHPLVSASEAASQAPTREATPAPEPAPGGTPEAAPAPEAAPEAQARRARKRDRAAREGSPPRYPGRRRRTQEAPGATALNRDEAAKRPARRVPPATPGRLGPSAYQAMDAQGRFGLVECSRIAAPREGARPQAAPGHTLVLAHTPPGRDPLALLGLCAGGTIRAVDSGGGAPTRGDVRIGFVTRSGYFPPGRPATSVLLGVASADWARVALG